MTEQNSKPKRGRPLGSKKVKADPPTHVKEFFENNPDATAISDNLADPVSLDLPKKFDGISRIVKTTPEEISDRVEAQKQRMRDNGYNALDNPHFK
jgi:hypothetical protein